MLILKITAPTWALNLLHYYLRSSRIPSGDPLMRLITLRLINTPVSQGKCLSTSKCVEPKIGVLLRLTFKADRVLKVRKQVLNLLLGWQGGVMLLNQMLLCKVKAKVQDLFLFMSIVMFCDRLPMGRTWPRRFGLRCRRWDWKRRHFIGERIPDFATETARPPRTYLTSEERILAPKLSGSYQRKEDRVPINGFPDRVSN